SSISLGSSSMCKTVKTLSGAACAPPEPPRGPDTVVSTPVCFGISDIIRVSTKLEHSGDKTRHCPRRAIQKPTLMHHAVKRNFGNFLREICFAPNVWNIRVPFVDENFSSINVLRPMLDHIPILLAEDDKNDIFLMRRAFDSAGYLNPLCVVHNGQEVVDYLEGAGQFSEREKYPVPG